MGTERVISARSRLAFGALSERASRIALREAVACTSLTQSVRARTILERGAKCEAGETGGELSAGPKRRRVAAVGCDQDGLRENVRTLPTIVAATLAESAARITSRDAGAHRSSASTPMNTTTSDARIHATERATQAIVSHCG